MLGLVHVPPAQAKAAETAELIRDRLAVVTAWQLGGPEVRAAAQQALLGTDAEIRRFLGTVQDERQRIDDRLAVGQLAVAGGPTVRDAAHRVLAGSDPAAVQAFLESGWEAPTATDSRVQVNQMMAAGGSHLKEAAQKALDANNTETLDGFINAGWRTPLETDQRLRVNQIMASGGPRVKSAAQKALDAGTLDAFTDFIESGWAVAAARDQELATITDLAKAAVAAGEEAARETVAAKEEAARASAAAAAAGEAAKAAQQAAARSQGNAELAAFAAERAAKAAKDAAGAARQAIGAAKAANAAARVAASAASRAASAAAMTDHAASKAYRAATNAASNAWAANNALEAADLAEQVAAGAQKASDAAKSAGDAATAAIVAVRSAGWAGDNAITAAQQAKIAARQAQAAGANATKAIRAAEQAEENAMRARRAAAAAEEYARASASAAFASREAANRAIQSAKDAAKAAREAAAHAGDAATAAKRSTDAANAASRAAEASVKAAKDAQTVFDAARKKDDERFDVAFAQAQADAMAAREEANNLRAKSNWDAAAAAKRSAETKRLIAEVSAPGTAPDAAVSGARRVALELAESDGPFTKAAATAALGGTDAEVVHFVRTGLPEAAGRDDRITLEALILAGSEAMQKAAEKALKGSDADVAEFLRTQNYPGRGTEDRLAVNRLLAAARQAGNTQQRDAAQKALDAGTDQALRDFLTTGQYSALAVDQRLKVNQIHADPNNGREVRDAAQVALDGPEASLEQFLTSGQYAAAERDAEAAAHIAEVTALMEQAQGAATEALAQAQQAQSAAAQARGDSTEATRLAAVAEQSARDAADFARKANQSADRAEKSAASAAASAKTAKKAAADANKAAQRAADSAVWAQASYRRAVGRAEDAARSARNAYDSAVAAGKDAQAALAASDRAAKTATEKANAELAAEMLKQAFACEGFKKTGFMYEYRRCMNLITASDQELARIAYSNSEQCAKLWKAGTAPYRQCLSEVLNPDFELGQAWAVTKPFVSLLTGALALGAMGLAAVVCKGPFCQAILDAASHMVIDGSDPKDLLDQMVADLLEINLSRRRGTVDALGLLAKLKRDLTDFTLSKIGLARLHKLSKKLEANGTLGPATVPPHLRHIADDYKRFGPYTREEFVKLYWNPNIKHYKTGEKTGGWNWEFAGPRGEKLDGRGIYHPDPRHPEKSSWPATPKVGDTWDRFGTDGGKFLSPTGTPFPERALPPDSLGQPYCKYKWLRPYDGKLGELDESLIAPAWGQPGLGRQFILKVPLSQFLDPPPPLLPYMELVEGRNPDGTPTSCKATKK
jgi:hypothetical protein